MTNSALQLEVDHCHAVCAELRAEIQRLKEIQIELAKEVDEAVERTGELSAQLEQSEIQRETFKKALKTIATCNFNSSVNGLRQYASGFLDNTGR